MAVVNAELSALFHESGARSGPAYERVKNLVISQIKSGRWSEGDQLPSENQLVSALGLSRMTINRALRELTDAGLIIRQTGVGTFVSSAKAPSSLFEVRNIADEIQQRGHRHSTHVLYVREEYSDQPSITREDLPSKIFHSLMVHFEDDIPIQVEDRIVNPAEAPGYLDQNFAEQTPNSYLSQVAPLERGEHIVEAVLGSVDECRLLDIDRSEPCLLIRRRTWSARGLVSAARLIHPGSRNRLVGTFDNR